MNILAGNPSQPMAELSLDPSERSWFCIRSHLKHEHIAAAHLRLIPEVEVFNPRLRLLRSTRRGLVWFTEAVFPNYLFARFALASKLQTVRYTNAVAMVVQFGDTVPSIAEATIEQLQRDLEELKSKVLSDSPEPGEEVEVAAGAFKGVTGSVIRVLPAKQRVEILLDFMGRSIPAEISLSSLLFRRKEAANLLIPSVEAVADPSDVSSSAQADRWERCGQEN